MPGSEARQGPLCVLVGYSLALRMSAGKSGVGGGECQVTWMQISCSFLLSRLPGPQVATANSPPPSFVYNESEELLSPGPYSDDPIMNRVGLWHTSGRDPEDCEAFKFADR